MSWEVSKILEGEKVAYDYFGASVSIHGNYAIVGSQGYSSSKGKVYWYERQRNGKWEEMHHEEGKNNGDRFGSSVAISGNYAIVGSYGYPGSGAYKGKVYWYERQRNGKWKEMHTKDGENNNDKFGESVAISGNYAIVGSTEYPSDASKGKVYWYERQRNGKWEEIHHEKGKNIGDRFGSSVAISGNYAIVGSSGYPGGSPTPAYNGKVYWYERQRNGKWEEMHHEEGKNNLDRFGTSVAISGNYAIVGSYKYPDGTDNGKVYWYERQRNGKWEVMHHEEGKTDDKLGYAVSIHGNYAIVSATGEGTGGDKAHIYQRKNNGKWEQISVKDNPIAGGNDFGDSVAIYKNYAIVGGDTGRSETNSGMAVIYNRENNFWGNS